MDDLIEAADLIRDEIKTIGTVNRRNVTKRKHLKWLHKEIEAKERAIRSPPVECVYFIQDTIGNIKIGVTTDLDQRFKMLQMANSCPLKIIGAVSSKDDRDLEASLHQKFKAHRLCGEWFSPAQEIFDYIAQSKD